MTDWNRDETTRTFRIRAWDWPLVLDVVKPPAYLPMRHAGRRHDLRQVLEIERELLRQGFRVGQELQERRVLVRP